MIKLKKKWQVILKDGKQSQDYMKTEFNVR